MPTQLDSRPRPRIAKRLPRVDVATPDQLVDAVIDYRPLVERVVARRVGDDPDVIADITQGALLRVLEQPTSSDFLRRWVRIARRLALDWRAAGARVELAGLDVAGDVAAVDPAGLGLSAAATEAMLASLTPRERDALRAWWEGYSLSEAAWRRHVGVAAFESRLRAARRRLRDLGIGAAALLGELARRLRRRARVAPQAVAPLPTQLMRVAATPFAPDTVPGVIVPLVIALLLGTVAATHSIFSPPAAPPDPTATLPASPRLLASAPTSTGRSTELHLIPPTVPALLHRALRGGDPPADTPANTQLTAVATAPDYHHHPVIVGIGKPHDSTCTCLALMRSEDAGHTWVSTTTAAPAGLDSSMRIVLPPSYPDDPRIFVYDPLAPGPSAQASPGFGLPFSRLPLPPGQLALSANFDTDDPRLFTASAGGVLSYDTAQHTVQPLLTPSPLVTAPPAMATPAQGGPIAIVILTAGSTASPHSTTPLPPGIVVCGPASCTSAATSGLAATAAKNSAQISLSPWFQHDHILAVFTSSSASLSTDAGAAFTSLPLPGTPSQKLESLSVTDTRAWALMTSPATPSAVYTSTLTTSAWQEVSPQGIDQSRGVLLTTNTDDVAAAFTLAFVCTSDDGRSWRAACAQ